MENNKKCQIDTILRGSESKKNGVDITFYFSFLQRFYNENVKKIYFEFEIRI